MAKERRTLKPHDRKTRIANEVGQAFKQHPEKLEGDRCVVLIYDEEGGGIGLFDYEDDTVAMVDIFMHLRAIMNANGKDLQFIAIPESPEGVDGAPSA